MHIVEKFTRKGDEILYDITIEDPDVLVEPWVMPTRILRPFGGDAESFRSAPIVRYTNKKRSRISFDTNR